MSSDRQLDEQFLPVLESAARLQKLVPDAVLVGGSAAAWHARHRVSLDHDHAVRDLRDRFDQVLEALEASDGWVTSRTMGPVLVLGSLDGIETGVRQLIRREPLEVERVVLPSGHELTVPTLSETLRVKAWMILRRNATRDYLDTVALAERAGIEQAATTLAEIDRWYADQQGPGGRRVATQLARQLAEPKPYDLDEVDLEHYRRLAPRWRVWTNVVATCRGLATALLARSLEP